MAVAAWILSVPLILEFVFGPLNLWRERTTGNWVRFTGYSSGAAKRVAAPVKLAVAALAVSGFHLVRLAAPSRRATDGIAAFVLFGALAAGLLAVQLAR